MADMMKSVDLNSTTASKPGIKRNSIPDQYTTLIKKNQINEATIAKNESLVRRATPLSRRFTSSNMLRSTQFSSLSQRDLLRIIGDRILLANDVARTPSEVKSKSNIELYNERLSKDKETKIQINLNKELKTLSTALTELKDKFSDLENVRVGKAYKSAINSTESKIDKYSNMGHIGNIFHKIGIGYKDRLDAFHDKYEERIKQSLLNGGTRKDGNSFTRRAFIHLEGLFGKKKGSFFEKGIEKNNASWSNRDSTALTTVIPGYLSKILTALNGERVGFDYRSNSFGDVKVINKRNTDASKYELLEAQKELEHYSFLGSTRKKNIAKAKYELALKKYNLEMNDEINSLSRFLDTGVGGNDISGNIDKQHSDVGIDKNLKDKKEVRRNYRHSKSLLGNALGTFFGSKNQFEDLIQLAFKPFGIENRLLKDTTTSSLSAPGYDPNKNFISKMLFKRGRNAIGTKEDVERISQLKHNNIISNNGTSNVNYLEKINNNVENIYGVLIGDNKLVDDAQKADSIDKQKKKEENLKEDDNKTLHDLLKAIKDLKLEQKNKTETKKKSGFNILSLASDLIKKTFGFLKNFDIKKLLKGALEVTGITSLISFLKNKFFPKVADMKPSGLVQKGKNILSTGWNYVKSKLGIAESAVSKAIPKTNLGKIAGSALGFAARWLDPAMLAASTLTYSKDLNPTTSPDDQDFPQKPGAIDSIKKKLILDSKNKELIRQKQEESRTLFPKLTKQYGLPKGLLEAVWFQESRKGRNLISPAGAEGDFQFMPKTAKEYGVDVTSFESSADGAARMYSDLLRQYNGNVYKALAAYNFGSGNLNKRIKSYNSNWVDHIPNETRNYVEEITSRMDTNQTRDRLASASSVPPRSKPENVAVLNNNGRNVSFQDNTLTTKNDKQDNTTTKPTVIKHEVTASVDNSTVEDLIRELNAHSSKQTELLMSILRTNIDKTDNKKNLDTYLTRNSFELSDPSIRGINSSSFGNNSNNSSGNGLFIPPPVVKIAQT